MHITQKVKEETYNSKRRNFSVASNFRDPPIVEHIVYYSESSIKLISNFNVRNFLREQKQIVKGERTVWKLTLNLFLQTYVLAGVCVSSIKHESIGVENIMCMTNKRVTT